jgi:hypothetical protein
MRKALALPAVLLVVSPVSGAAATPRHAAAAPRVSIIRTLSFEFVGQFQNSAPGVTPASHAHYGYLSYAAGLRAFAAEPGNEATALFTFNATAQTVRVIADGPLRVITRVGRLTIYRDATPNGDFADPASFRDGDPVLVARFRQQSVVDTVSNTFTTFHQNRITSTTPFRVSGKRVQVGVVGARFTTQFTGRVNMPGPPSGFLGGYAGSR